MTNIAEFVLVYSDSEGNTYEIKESKRTDSAVLFAKKFSSSETATYKINRMNYAIEGVEEEQTLLFNDVEIKADFTVVNNQEDNVAKAVNENTTTTSIDVDELAGNVEALLTTANVSTAAETGGNIVVVIDPGHGGKDPGACGHGLKEKDLVLKISQYLKAELEEYQGVDVYMTREVDTSAMDELASRVAYAASKNADLLVSIHINAGGGKGAEVWTPNSNYNSDVYYEGQAVSHAIQDQLVDLGLYDRGVKIRNSGDNTLYPDRSLADYYGIIRRSKLEGFTGIIVEHAYIDNASDAAFLKSESNLRELGIADATGIAEHFGLQKEPTVEIEDGTYTIGNSDGLRLGIEDKSIANGAKISLIPSSDEINSSQRFELINIGKREFKIMIEHSGKVLDVQNANFSAGATVQQYEWNGTPAQKWRFVDTEDGSGSCYIKSKLGTYLAINEDGKYTVTATKEDAVKWVLEKSESRPIANGIYGVANKANSSMMLDISGASMANGGNAQMYSMNSTLAQQFDVRYAGNGYYTIKTMHSNKAIDVKSASTEVGANLWQYDSNGTDAQLWKFIDAGNGYYYIRSKLGTTISPNSSSLKNSTNVNMAMLNGKDIQKWMLEDISKPISDGQYLILSNIDSLRAMTTKNGNTQINVYDNIDGQKYDINYIGDGYYKISNKATGKVLEVAGSSKSAGANLCENTWKSTDNQQWIIAHIGTGKYVLKSKLGTFIDVSSASIAENNNIWMYSYNGTGAQIWKFDNSRVNQPVKPIVDGTYVFKSALKNSKVIDISGGSLSDSANAQLYESNNTSAQRFEITYVSNGYYKISCEKSGKSLDVASGSTKSGANLWQYVVNGTDAQLWKFIDAGNGYYYIKSPKGTVIDVASAKTGNGTNIWMYSLNGTNAQKWKPTKQNYTPISEGEYAFKSALRNDRLMESADSTAEAGTNIRLGNALYNSNQHFKVIKANDAYGYYKIELANTGLYLDVKDASVSAGTNLQLNTESNSAGQLWKFIDVGDGYYYIKSKLGTAVDVTSANSSVGTNICLYTMNGTGAQKWKLTQNDLTSIAGSSSVTATNLAAYYKSKKKSYPYTNISEASTIEAFAQIYIEECAAEGIRADVAFCQAMKETGWLQFGGQVKANQYNFAGLGATDNGAAGASFKSIRTGIRAQVQHLKAYANTEPLVNECVDPRFHYVTRGCAPYVEWLGQKENPSGKGWATARGYGASIVNMMKEL